MNNNPNGEHFSKLVDKGPDRFRSDGLRTEDSHPMYFTTGPSRTVEFGGSRKNVNKHQEGISHDDKCRCNEHKNNDLVVMYEHINQYPAFSCYCKLCLEMVMGRMSCENIEDLYEMMKSKITILLEVEGIKLGDPAPIMYLKKVLQCR